MEERLEKAEAKIEGAEYKIEQIINGELKTMELQLSLDKSMKKIAIYMEQAGLFQQKTEMHRANDREKDKEFRREVRMKLKEISDKRSLDTNKLFALIRKEKDERLGCQNKCNLIEARVVTLEENEKNTKIKWREVFVGIVVGAVLLFLAITFKIKGS